MQFRVLFQDNDLVLIDKPAGVSVHPPLDRPNQADRCVVKNLRDQLGKWVYPVHRLDRATSGVLVMALKSEVAAKFQEKFQKNEIEKTYLALVRGWTEVSGKIDSPLSKELGDENLVNAITHFERMHAFELPHSLGLHATVRYSLLKIKTETGRLHQIRRHLKRISHPIVGDTVHGDGKHNQLFRQITDDKLLYLKAYSLKFCHPFTQENIYVHSRWNAQWHKVFDLAGFCPILK